MSDIQIYDTSGPEPVNFTFIKAPLEYTQNVLVWTEIVGSGSSPTHLIISGKASKRVYLQPRLQAMNGSTMLFRILEEQPSGSGAGFVERFLVVTRTTFHS